MSSLSAGASCPRYFPVSFRGFGVRPDKRLDSGGRGAGVYTNNMLAFVESDSASFASVLSTKAHSLRAFSSPHKVHGLYGGIFLQPFVASLLSDGNNNPCEKLYSNSLTVPAGIFCAYGFVKEHRTGKKKKMSPAGPSNQFPSSLYPARLICFDVWRPFSAVLRAC